MDESEQISLSEACRRLRMSRERVILRINNGELIGGQTMGRWWFVTVGSIERYLADQESV